MAKELPFSEFGKEAICPYCQGPAEIIPSTVPKSDSNKKNVIDKRTWRCRSCNQIYNTTITLDD